MDEKTRTLWLIVVMADAYAVCDPGTCNECDILIEVRDMALKALQPEGARQLSTARDSSAFTLPGDIQIPERLIVSPANTTKPIPPMS